MEINRVIYEICSVFNSCVFSVFSCVSLVLPKAKGLKVVFK